MVLIGALFVYELTNASGASAEESSAPPLRDCMETPECVELVQSARRLSDAGQLNAAMQTYESAYRQWQSPWLLINIGRIHQKLGRPVQAISTYHDYFDRAGNDSPERIAAARDFLRQAEQDLADKRAKAARSANHPPEKPAYKKWWFWTTIGSTAAVATAFTVGIVIGTRSSAAELVLPANTLMFGY